MINAISYHNDASEASRILDTLDAYETDAQFEDRKEKNRLLHLCKTKGFKHLEALGPKYGGIERSVSKKPVTPRVSRRTREEWREEMRQRAIKSLEMYKDGMTIKSIAKELGIGRDQIRHNWRRFNLDAPTHISHLWEPRMAKILALLDQGESIAGASRKMGIPCSTVQYQLKRQKNASNPRS